MVMESTEELEARFPLPDVADLRKCIEHGLPINRCRPCWTWYRRHLGALCVRATIQQIDLKTGLKRIKQRNRTHQDALPQLGW